MNQVTPQPQQNAPLEPVIEYVLADYKEKVDAGKITFALNGTGDLAILTHEMGSDVLGRRAEPITLGFTLHGVAKLELAADAELRQAEVTLLEVQERIAFLKRVSKKPALAALRRDIEACFAGEAGR